MTSYSKELDSGWAQGGPTSEEQPPWMICVPASALHMMLTEAERFLELKACEGNRKRVSDYFLKIAKSRRIRGTQEREFATHVTKMPGNLRDTVS